MSRTLSSFSVPGAVSEGPQTVWMVCLKRLNKNIHRGTVCDVMLLNEIHTKESEGGERKSTRELEEE